MVDAALHQDAMTRGDVLIIGAGPTGLVLALWLTKLGVKVRIVDKTAEAGTTSRALAVQARTLELYRQLDLAGAVLERGHKPSSLHYEMHVNAGKHPRFLLRALGFKLDGDILDRSRPFSRI
jgi:2-polyprenyl-6-methoxyphenol hydroxylase-like FAD-dependent oxidoreductase